MSGSVWDRLGSVVTKCKGHLLAAGGGFALFLADYPASRTWLAFIAFAPLFWVVLRARSAAEACAFGVAWGGARTLPLAWMLDGFGLPWGLRLVVTVCLLLLDAVFAACAFWLRRAVPGLLLSAALFALLEYADSRLPMWGTARSIARLVTPVSGARFLIAAVGSSGTALWLVSFQALVVAGIQRRQRFTALAGLLVFAAAIALGVRSAPRTTRTLRVAAIGWAEQHATPDVESLVAAASKQGARLVVFPEAAFELRPGKPRASFEAEWSKIAVKYAVFLVVPVLDRQTPGNRLLVFSAAGAKLGEYTKRNLVPLAEPFPPGNGDLLLFDVEGVRVGTLICHDDNYPDLARAYSARGAELLAIPTFEGPAAVAPYHLRNTTLRAIENPLALVRAAAQGESAVIAPGGAVLVTFDHSSGGTFVVTADAPIVDRSDRPSRRVVDAR